MEPTIVPALSGAVLKQSPADFVVVEEPLYGASTFTPADPSEPLPEHVRKPVIREVKAWLADRQAGRHTAYYSKAYTSSMHVDMFEVFYSFEMVEHPGISTHSIFSGMADFAETSE